MLAVWVGKEEEQMPGNNSKYTPEYREETARFVIESGRSATSVAEDIGIDKNTVCSWVREYRKKAGLPVSVLR